MDAGLVLDAQPLVALLAKEPDAQRVEERLRTHAGSGGVLISAVNWCEVLYIVQRRAGAHAAARVAALLEQSAVSVIGVDTALAGFAADVKARHGLGLGDAFAAGLALATGLPLLTADADFLPLAESGLLLDWLG